MYQITIGGETKQCPEGMTYEMLAAEYQEKYSSDIILAKLNGRLRELFREINEDGKVEFVTLSDDAGHKTYVRALILVMLRAMYRVAKETKCIEKVRVEFTLGAAWYGEIDWKSEEHPEKEAFLAQVKKEMERLIEADLPFQKHSMETREAIKLFHEVGMYEKEKLFQYRRVSRTNVYELDGFYDYYYGYMPKSTSVLKLFDLQAYEDGFILLMPEKKRPGVLPEFVPREKLYRTLKSADDWARAVRLENVGDLNHTICGGNISDMILVQEAYQEKKIAEIAEQIYRAGGKKFIMIAGPSSSGKTTFSHRLSIQLRTLGLNPHPIAVDDYFVNRENTPKDENGNYNFETLGAIDVEQFNADMNALLRGERVELPTFNFKTGRREYKGNYKQLGAEDILVIEGIHCLNDALSYSLPRESKFKIYISALTQLNVDEHNRIATTDGRLIRRMVRDARTRGTSARNTIAMWPSVRRGEEENIFPFQEDADCMFNSALIYELAVLKQYAEPLLFGIPTDCEEYAEAKRLLKFLDYFLGVSSEEIPKNSILREFVGGSCFKV
ncbi:MAG: nucleoside kinase [Lachnospiraceae bacterium]|nr:nucleoside kinase [Lachnospiraceae bacterium]